MSELQEKVEKLIEHISIANGNVGLSSTNNKIHNFEIIITTYINIKDFTFVEVKDTEELLQISDMLINELKNLSFKYEVKDCRIRGVEKGFMYINFYNLLL
jgi:hypothetical protein